MVFQVKEVNWFLTFPVAKMIGQTRRSIALSMHPACFQKCWSNQKITVVHGQKLWAIASYWVRKQLFLNCLVCKKNVELKFIAFCLSLIVAFSSCLQSSLEVHEQNFYFRCMHAGSFGKSSKSDWWGICNTLKIQSQKKLQQRSQHSLEFKQAYFRDHLNAI